MPSKFGFQLCELPSLDTLSLIDFSSRSQVLPMDTRNQVSPNSNPPRASLLGLPPELRLAIYDYVFTPINYHQPNPLKSWKEERPKSTVSLPGLPLYFCAISFPELSTHIHADDYEHWDDTKYIMVGNAESSQQNRREHLTALFTVPYVCRQMHRELRNLTLELPPISKINFIFRDFTKQNMQQFASAIGDDNVSRIRKWTIIGSARCRHMEYRDGHLLKGFNYGCGPCAFFNNRKECNRRCRRLAEQEQYRLSRCTRKVHVELDKCEEQDDSLQDVAPSRGGEVSAERRLEQVKAGLSDDRETAKKALLMYRHVVISANCSDNLNEEACYLSDPVDQLFNEEGDLELNRQTFIRMLEAVTGGGMR